MAENFYRNLFFLSVKSKVSYLVQVAVPELLLSLVIFPLQCCGCCVGCSTVAPYHSWQASWLWWCQKTVVVAAYLLAATTAGDMKRQTAALSHM